MKELALRRHVQLILSSFKKKRPKQLPKSTDDALQRPFYMCKQQTIHPSASEFLFKNFLVCSQKWLIMITIMIITQLPGLGWYSLLVWWYIGLEPPKKVSGFLQTPLVCRWERFCQPSLPLSLALGCQQLVRSGQVCCCASNKRKQQNNVNSPWEDGGDGSMLYYSLFSDPGISERFWVSNPLVCRWEFLLALCNWA